LWFCLSNYPITLGDCWVFNFGDFGSSGNFGNLFCCRAMTAITAMTAIPLRSFVSSVVKAFVVLPFQLPDYPITQLPDLKVPRIPFVFLRVLCG
jgi:hypothetical protein